jgi:hypothetical protein
MEHAWRRQLGEPCVVQPVGGGDETQLPDCARQIPKTDRTGRGEHSPRGSYLLSRFVEPAKHEQRLHFADALEVAASFRRRRRQLLEDRTGECRRFATATGEQEEARGVDAGIIGFGVARSGFFCEDRMIQPGGLAQLRPSLFPCARKRVLLSEPRLQAGDIHAHPKARCRCDGAIERQR